MDNDKKGEILLFELDLCYIKVGKGGHLDAGATKKIDAKRPGIYFRGECTDQSVTSWPDMIAAAEEHGDTRLPKYYPTYFHMAVGTRLGGVLDLAQALREDRAMFTGLPPGRVYVSTAHVVLRHYVRLLQILATPEETAALTDAQRQTLAVLTAPPPEEKKT